jgi:predicted HTH domain antitoxin
MGPEAFEQEARTALAMKLYELGRVTSGQAAALAGISRVEFLLSCRQYGSYSVEWDAEEIEEEFRAQTP